MEKIDLHLCQCEDCQGSTNNAAGLALRLQELLLARSTKEILRLWMIQRPHFREGAYTDKTCCHHRWQKCLQEVQED